MLFQWIVYVIFVFIQKSLHMVFSPIFFLNEEQWNAFEMYEDFSDVIVFSKLLKLSYCVCVKLVTALRCHL